MQLEHQIGDREFATIEKRDRGGIAGKTTLTARFALRATPQRSLAVSSAIAYNKQV